MNCILCRAIHQVHEGEHISLEAETADEPCAVAGDEAAVPELLAGVDV